LEKTDIYNDWEKARDWEKAKASIFWGEIAPCDHVVQIYESDDIFMDALAGFVGNGINAGDCVIVIATAPHLKGLENRLALYAAQIDALKADNRYVPLIAEEVLSRFMINGWPDERLFMDTVSKLLEPAYRNNRRVRAFGEMVAILWAQGHYGATVHLEHLWNKFCEKQEFCLFCAYPRSGFTGNIHASINHICGKHSKLIAGSEKQMTDIFYRNIG